MINKAKLFNYQSFFHQDLFDDVRENNLSMHISIVAYKIGLLHETQIIYLTRRNARKIVVR